MGGADLTMTPTDTIGIVTIHDGAPLESGEIIAPEVRGDNRDHNYFQDPEVFLALGGRRGKQLQVLTDGTFFINRWFATVEVRPKTLIPIGYVGVVVSYYGSKGEDVTGEGVPLWRTGRAGPARRVETGAASGQVSGESVRREGRARSDGELRSALDHRPGRSASVRQGSCQHRADHGRWLRAGAAAVAGAAHRLREGAERRAAFRRCATADHADARSDSDVVFPRCRAVVAHARPADAS